ncbi:hypothetical protein SAMD00019534_078380, partial [Acytostelium subglobosum LB1]|uniref:hypothetical protein n=1 Tax=Acytostelium subglobosum LB1 TaxID=1410327 RepID=UPI000644DBCA
MTAKLLSNQLKGLMNDPVEGFTVELVNESSLFEWKIYLEGPRDTYYEGGVFQLLLTFPKDYPMSPPSLRFLSDFWHPNVYQKEGKVCISILHPPGEDVMSGELPQERWLPTQTVSTIILSVMSILSDPNCSSPANVDASVEWRQNREAYKKRCAKLVEKANAQKPAHIVIPHPDTNPEEHKKSVEKIKLAERGMDIDYFDMEDEEYQFEEDEAQDDDDDEVEDCDDDEISTEDEEEQEVVSPTPVVVDKPISNSNSNNSSSSNSDMQEVPTGGATTSGNTVPREQSDLIVHVAAQPQPPLQDSTIVNVNTAPTTTTTSSSSSTSTSNVIVPPVAAVQLEPVAAPVAPAVAAPPARGGLAESSRNVNRKKSKKCTIM